MGVSTSPGLPHALEDAPHPHPRVHGGVYFTWASPCSGGCSTPTPKCGWGICSNAQWAKIDVNQMKKDKPCSSKIFDAKYNHCDSSNNLVQHNNGGYDELVFCFH